MSEMNPYEEDVNGRTLCKRHSMIRCGECDYINELEELQGLPRGYTEGISNTQRKKAIGNGWTVDVISHIFKGLK